MYSANDSYYCIQLTQLALGDSTSHLHISPDVLFNSDLYPSGRKGQSDSENITDIEWVHYLLILLKWIAESMQSFWLIWINLSEWRSQHL